MGVCLQKKDIDKRKCEDMEDLFVFNNYKGDKGDNYSNWLKENNKQYDDKTRNVFYKNRNSRELEIENKNEKNCDIGYEKNVKQSCHDYKEEGKCNNGVASHYVGIHGCEWTDLKVTQKHIEEVKKLREFKDWLNDHRNEEPEVTVYDYLLGNNNYEDSIKIFIEPINGTKTLSEEGKINPENYKWIEKEQNPEIFDPLSYLINQDDAEVLKTLKKERDERKNSKKGPCHKSENTEKELKNIVNVLLKVTKFLVRIFMVRLLY